MIVKTQDPPSLFTLKNVSFKIKLQAVQIRVPDKLILTCTWVPLIADMCIIDLVYAISIPSHLKLFCARNGNSEKYFGCFET